jgi:hypothetical protein
MPDNLNGSARVSRLTPWKSPFMLAAMKLTQRSSASFVVPCMTPKDAGVLRMLAFRRCLFSLSFPAYVFSVGCGEEILVCRTPRGVWTFSRVSRSETTMVAVGLSPRTAAKHTNRRRGATAELSKGTVAFNRRSATRDHNTPHPWTEVHGYHHGLAPRGAGVEQTFLSALRPALNTYAKGEGIRLAM